MSPLASHLSIRVHGCDVGPAGTGEVTSPEGYISRSRSFAAPFAPARSSAVPKCGSGREVPPASVAPDRPVANAFGWNVVSGTLDIVGVFGKSVDDHNAECDNHHC